MDIHHLYLLSASLAIGLLIGIERGWKAREVKEGARVAGVRTFALIGLLGGISGLLSKALSPMILGFIFIGFAALITFSYGAHIKNRDDIGITSLVAALLTFLLGAIASLGYLVEGASVAVISAILLRSKPILHEWLRKIEKKELIAALELLLISVVLLSILPNKGYGPWQALNPFEIWSMVVLVSSVSFVGYFAIKMIGARKGLLLTALFAGFVASTILTFHYSKLSRKKPKHSLLFTTGILIACSMMFFRIILFIAILNPILLTKAMIPLLVMGVWAMLLAMVTWVFSKRHAIAPQESIINNPLEIKSALVFGVVLSLVTLIIKGSAHTTGEMGIYAFSAFSGFFDVDAIVIPLLRLEHNFNMLNTTTVAIIIAASSNTVLKAIIAIIFGGQRQFWQATLPLLSTLVLGYFGLFITIL